MYTTMIISSFFISFILTIIALPMLVNMLMESNVVYKNFKQDTIPISMGVLFIFVQIITLNLLNLIYDFQDNYILVYFMGFIFMGFLGLFDDLTGDKNTKGLKGHIKSFLKGKLTTGFLKASFGFFIGLAVSSYISHSTFEFIVNGFIMGLFTNFINLFDLRPGRAGKVFIIISIIFALSSFYGSAYILISFLGILIPYMKLDLKAKVMMGDVGSNTLGFTLGYFAAINYNINVKIGILIFLIVMHLLAEKISFTKIIEKNKVLNYIDQLGRR